MGLTHISVINPKDTHIRAVNVGIVRIGIADMDLQNVEMPLSWIPLRSLSLHLPIDSSHMWAPLAVLVIVL